MNAIWKKVEHTYYPTQEVLDGATTPLPIAHNSDARSEKKESNSRKESTELESAARGCGCVVVSRDVEELSNKARTVLVVTTRSEVGYKQKVSRIRP